MPWLRGSPGPFLLLVACTAVRPGTDAEEQAARRAVLESVGRHVIGPAATGWVASAEALDATIGELADAADDPEARDSARLAFTAAMAGWQELEGMQVGPAASPSVSAAGEGLRDEIYSWPTTDTCAVDRAIADESYAAEGFVDDSLVYAYGLDALEYLAFVDAPGHTCAAAIGLDAAWDALSPEELQRRRAAYAEVVAANVLADARALAQRWDPAQGDFAARLARPGEGDSPWTDVDDALDDVFAALFYVDLSTKDQKLGRPLGLVDGCAAPPCPDLFELPHSGGAGTAIAANLEALRRLVLGGDDAATGEGFDDLLARAGHADVAEELLADIVAARDEALALDQPLAALAVDEPERVQALHAAIKRVTDTLKGPFVMVLRLRVPSEGAGDND
jgi:predicted lipoprotein